MAKTSDEGRRHSMAKIAQLSQLDRLARKTMRGLNGGQQVLAGLERGKGAAANQHEGRDRLVGQIRPGKDGALLVTLPYRQYGRQG